jgi:stress-induced-phosphoprotein 1
MHGLGDLLGAHDAYEEGIKLDPANVQNKSGLDAVKRAIDAEAKAGTFIQSVRMKCVN